MTPTERANLIDRLVQAAIRPLPEIVESFELLGTDGKWHSPYGFPAGVQTTGERRSVGFVFCDRGVRYGTRAASREELIARSTASQHREAVEFQQEMERRDDKGLQQAAVYWLK